MKLLGPTSTPHKRGAESLGGCLGRQERLENAALEALVGLGPTAAPETKKRGTRGRGGFSGPQRREQ